MLEDPRARALLIHVAAYLVVVAICAGVNLWLTPNRLWFVWVALGWGIGVAAHALAFWLRHSDRREVVFTDRRMRGFAVHAFAYVAVIILLFVVNLTVSPNRWWFYWVALGWGAGVAAHAWLAFRPRPAPKSHEPRRRKPAKRKPAKRSR